MGSNVGFGTEGELPPPLASLIWERLFHRPCGGKEGPALSSRCLWSQDMSINTSVNKPTKVTVRVASPARMFHFQQQDR